MHAVFRRGGLLVSDDRGSLLCGLTARGSRAVFTAWQRTAIHGLSSRPGARAGSGSSTHPPLRRRGAGGRARAGVGVRMSAKGRSTALPRSLTHSEPHAPVSSPPGLSTCLCDLSPSAGWGAPDGLPPSLPRRRSWIRVRDEFQTGSGGTPSRGATQFYFAPARAVVSETSRPSEHGQPSRFPEGADVVGI